MNKAFSKILVIIIISIAGAGIFIWQMLLNSSVSGTGTIRFIDLEGGFYGIEGDNGKKYDPMNLADEFKQDGLRVNFVADEKNNAASTHMWGTMVEIRKIKKIENRSSEEENGHLAYTNNQYGFEIILPDSWQGYSVINEIWQGTTLDARAKEYQGPEVVIRNPKWTSSQPWQDIPILVFTKEEWQLIENQNLGIFAAPVGPIKLDESQQYVFALPPRWVGFIDTLGQEEAQGITETFKAFNL